MIHKNNSLKIGLALGSGAARGLTHIGVLKAIEEHGIKIDYISGSSIGALIGAAYAIGMSAQEIEDIAIQTDWKLMAKIFLPSLSLSSIVNTKYLSEFLSTWFGNKTFDDLKIPFSAVTTDIQTGRMVVLEKGDLLSAIRASISIPVIFSPVTIGKYKLVDGGLVNPTPVDVVKKKGIDKVIAVNLRRFGTYGIGQENGKQIPEVNKKVKELSLNEKIQYFIKHPINFLNDNSNEKIPDPKIWSVLYQMFIIVQVQISDLTMQIAKPDILIEPNTSDFKVFEFSKAKELIEVGYSTAKKQLKNFD
ncbi:patatin-like phospholipase family protein [Melioribacteraceae bacterium 4301-Me]|uniref:patatin-like phospholipase family protein n=1 Tax=Pyranulibacter aquaticus TaxID=3163344 RepID=UPI00359C0C89